jgi:hypothetical protein
LPEATRTGVFTRASAWVTASSGRCCSDTPGTPG